jgi:hypothetical protein
LGEKGVVVNDKHGLFERKMWKLHFHGRPPRVNQQLHWYLNFLEQGLLELIIKELNLNSETLIWARDGISIMFRSNAKNLGLPWYDCRSGFYLFSK